MLCHSAPPKPHLKRDTFPRVPSALKPREVRSVTVKHSGGLDSDPQYWSCPTDNQSEYYSPYSHLPEFLVERKRG